MLARLILSMIKLDYKNSYYHLFTIVSEIIAILGTLLIYWFTSKAFSASVDAHLNQSYFSYILVGDLFLSLPLYFVSTFVRKIKLSVHDGSFQLMLSLPVSILKILFVLGTGGLIRDIIRTIITLSIAMILFDFPSSPLNILKAILFEIIFIIPFVNLGILFSLIILYIGRGESFLGYLNTLGSFLAGSFFPIAVLPPILQNLSNSISPLTFELEQVRHILLTGTYSGSFSIFFTTIILWSIGTTLVTAAGHKVLLNKMRHSGFNFLITY